jgi:capsular polysaccharide biosynthesis protein
MRFSNRYSFPVFGRCSGTISLAKAGSAELAKQSILKTTVLNQDEVYRDLPQLPTSSGRPGAVAYPRPLFVSTLADAYVTHQGGYITRDSRLIEEFSQHYDYPIAEHRYLHSLRMLRAFERIDRPVIALTGAGQYNYCHWWLDILPKLHLIRRYGEMPADPLYYVESFKPFQKELLGYFGLTADSVLSSREHGIIRPRHLLAASPRSPLQQPDPWAVAWTRATFSRFAVGHPAKPRCVLISRRKAKTRRIVNEEEIAACLAPLQPTIVDLEDLTVAQQIGLFAEAKWIIAPHGAGLTNMIFAQKDCQIIELFGSEKINDCYRYLAEVVGCAHTFLLGENVIDPRDGQTHMRADVVGLKAALFG